MPPRIVDPSPTAIAEAAERLRAGRLVAFPTETVYGLGAGTFHAAALVAVYELKGRPAENPLIAHVTGPDGPAGARRVSAAWTEAAAALADRFWPGPLTLVLAKEDDVPVAATAGLPTIAVRAPRHPVAQDLLASFGAPISAPSANRSGLVSPTSARHVADDFAAVTADLVVLDGGDSAVGLESTVLDLTGAAPTVLRPGTVTVDELRSVLAGEVLVREIAEQTASPGTSPRHYAPRTVAELVEPGRLADRLRGCERPCAVLCFDASSVPPPHRGLEMPQGAGDYAHRLYAALRSADALGTDRIVIEMPPGTNETWRAVRDRLRRATAPG